MREETSITRVFELQKHLNDRRKQKQAEERERKKAEEKKYQEELAKWEEEQAKMKPWLTEIGECDRIIEYLKPMVPKKVVAQESASKKSTVLKMADGTIIESMSKKGSSSESSIGLSDFREEGEGGSVTGYGASDQAQYRYVSTFKKMGISLPSTFYFNFTRFDKTFT